MKTRIRTLLVAPAAVAAIAVLAPVGPVDARHRPHQTTVRVAVADEDGAPRRDATVMACTYRDGTPDCATPRTAPTDRRGVAKLRLAADRRYEFTAFVRDPNPAWACPGLVIDGHELYFAEHPFSATPREARRTPTLTIVEPTPADCPPPIDTVAEVRVVDGNGNPLPTAGMFICPLAADGTPCPGPSFDGPDPDGLIRFDVDPAVTYRLNAFINNSGWPCPDYVNGAGTFHFSPITDHLGADLLTATTTFIITQPDPSACAPPTAVAEVRVVDGNGNPLPTAGMFICPLAADGTPCPGPSFDGPDPDGLIRFDVDPAVTYRLNAFINNSGWPCPDYVNGAGTFHFSPITDHLGADLLAGTTTFVITQPDPSACAPV